MLSLFSYFLNLNLCLDLLPLFDLFDNLFLFHFGLLFTEHRLILLQLDDLSLEFLNKRQIVLYFRRLQLFLFLESFLMNLANLFFYFVLVKDCNLTLHDILFKMVKSVLNKPLYFICLD